MDIKISSINGLRFYNYIYKEATIFLERKKDVFDKFIEYFTKKVKNFDVKFLDDNEIENIYKSLHLPDKDAILAKFGEDKLNLILKFYNSGMSQGFIMRTFNIRFSTFYKIMDYLNIKFKPREKGSWLIREPNYLKKANELKIEYENF